MSGAAVTTPPKPNWFTTEIQLMMHGFGDCQKPLLESATIVEEIVHQQLVALIYQAEKIASMRNGRFISLEDFLFLLRKDKVKLRRLIRFMELKDMKAANFKYEEEETSESVDGKQPPKKKRKIAYDFLSAIDQTGELIALFEDDGVDEVKQERALRAELRSRNMDTQHYMDFCEARQASFSPRYKSQRFKEWLVPGMTLDIKPNPLAIEVLLYLAYETVAQIVDLTLIVRRDACASVSDPFKQVEPPVCVNHEIPIVPHPSPTPGVGSAKSPSRTASPGASTSQGKQSPPDTPTGTSTSPGHAGFASATSPSHAQASVSSSSNTANSSGSKSSKSKKKKKSESQTTKEASLSQAIQPSDIREAMRRYGQNLGPFADFSKLPLLFAKQRIVSC